MESSESAASVHVTEAINQKNEAMTMLLRDLQEEIRSRDSELAQTRLELAARIEENSKLMAQGMCVLISEGFAQHDTLIIAYFDHGCRWHRHCAVDCQGQPTPFA